MDLASFRRLPLLGILRGGDHTTIEPLVEAAIRAGLQTLEITMNTPDAAGLIQAACHVAGSRLTIGAGTVLTRDDVVCASEAGATFIVSPVLVPEVTEESAARSLASFPGAMTPSEIYQAWKSGAAMVKVFPASVLGPTYFGEIKGPFNDVELLACGGVRASNVRTYFAAGASAVAFGGSVFAQERLRNGAFAEIEEDIRELVRSVQEVTTR